jgi:hypothetical protein
LWDPARADETFLDQHEMQLVIRRFDILSWNVKTGGSIEMRSAKQVRQTAIPIEPDPLSRR